MAEGRGRAHREERAANLLAAAIRSIRRHGPECSIDQIAAEVGVTRPIIYRYFGSREGLAREVAAYAGAGLGRLVRSVIAEAQPGRPMLKAAIGAYLQFIETEPELYRFVLRQRFFAGGDRTSSERSGRSGTPVDGDGGAAGFVELLGRELAGVIGEQLDRSGADRAPAETWAFALVGMVGMAGEWWLARLGTGAAGLDREQLTDHLTQLAWAGMSSATRERSVPR